MRFDLQSGYARLPERFYARLAPTPVAKPRLIKFNMPLAAELGFHGEALGTEALNDALVAVFSGNALPPGADPIAMAYAGHQFGQFVPQLGDGRAILLGEVQDRNGVRRELQLKGAGRTPYSRNGDGRAALGPVLREYLVSEAMHALKIPATRALAAVTTGESVARDQMLPGAIITRVAASHVRVGTFQYFAARGDNDALKQLADFVIDRHYPQSRTTERPYLDLLQAVSERQARLIASWMHVGFIHGVMNTDNMAVSGETIDFGPCAFIDTYDPAAVFSSIDARGRYAYMNQPHAAQWNLARLAETLLPIVDLSSEQSLSLANEVIASFPARFEEYWLAGMRQKVGLTTPEADDRKLIEGLLDTMHRSQADFTLTFRGLCDASENLKADAGLRELFSNPVAYDEWAAQWRLRLQREPQESHARRAAAMRQANPIFIPRNHRIEEVINAAVKREDFAPFEELLGVLARPFDALAGFETYANPPQLNERVLQTFCGT